MLTTKDKLLATFGILLSLVIIGQALACGLIEGHELPEQTANPSAVW